MHGLINLRCNPVKKAIHTCAYITREKTRHWHGAHVRSEWCSRHWFRYSFHPLYRSWSPGWVPGRWLLLVPCTQHWVDGDAHKVEMKIVQTTDGWLRSTKAQYSAMHKWLHRLCIIQGAQHTRTFWWTTKWKCKVSEDTLTLWLWFCCCRQRRPARSLGGCGQRTAQLLCSQTYTHYNIPDIDILPTLANWGRKKWLCGGTRSQSSYVNKSKWNLNLTSKLGIIIKWDS